MDGYLELSLETLEELDAADFAIGNTDDDVVMENLAAVKSALWKQLDVVTGNRIAFVGAWNGSDMLQLYRMLADVERVLVLPAEAGTSPLS